MYHQQDWDPSLLSADTEILGPGLLPCLADILHVSLYDNWWYCWAGGDCGGFPGLLTLELSLVSW